MGCALGLVVSEHLVSVFRSPSLPDGFVCRFFGMPTFLRLSQRLFAVCLVICFLLRLLVWSTGQRAALLSLAFKAITRKTVSSAFALAKLRFVLRDET